MQTAPEIWRFFILALASRPLRPSAQCFLTKQPGATNKKVGGAKKDRWGGLPHPRGMHSPAGNWFVEVDIAITDLDIESAVGIAAHPCLVVNGSALAPEVR